MDQTGRLTLGRHAQWHDRALAKSIKAKGEIRSQFCHVIDVAPTILEAAGLPHPMIVNSVQQAPMKGFSMLYSFDDAKAADRDETQYFEIFCNRGIYHKGRTAMTRHSAPWDVSKPMSDFDDDVWELYDANEDWTPARDLASTNPQKLHELQRLWLIEAAKYSVLPLDDRRVERLNLDLADRPQLIKGKRQILFGGMRRLTENSVINIKNEFYPVTAEVIVPSSGAEGVIIAQGGSFAGWSLYVENGKLKYRTTFLESNCSTRSRIGQCPRVSARFGWNSNMLVRPCKRRQRCAVHGWRKGR